jgi:hypothetical protein
VTEGGEVAVAEGGKEAGRRRRRRRRQWQRRYASPSEQPSLAGHTTRVSIWLHQALLCHLSSRGAIFESDRLLILLIKSVAQLTAKPLSVTWSKDATFWIVPDLGFIRSSCMCAGGGSERPQLLVDVAPGPGDLSDANGAWLVVHKPVAGTPSGGRGSIPSGSSSSSPLCKLCSSPASLRLFVTSTC